MDLKAYHGIITEIWKATRYGLEHINSGITADSPAWADIVSRFEAIEENAPPEMKRYAGNMVLMHINELENIWRKEAGN